MAKVKNTKRNPLDIEIDGRDNPNLNLGPRGESRELTAEEMQSAQVQANIAAGNLVVIADDPKAQKTKAAAQPEKDGDK